MLKREKQFCIQPNVYVYRFSAFGIFFATILCNFYSIGSSSIFSYPFLGCVTVHIMILDENVCIFYGKLYTKEIFKRD